MLVLGISGATCSGKTSICKILQRIFVNSRLFCQDDYYWPTDSENHSRDSNSVINWEIPSAFDMNAMFHDLRSELSSSASSTKSIVASPPTPWSVESVFSSPQDCQVLLDPDKFRDVRLVLVEGILVLNDSRISELCHHRFFIDLDHETCWSRRQGRTYDPQDKLGYFDRYVWPHYLTNLEALRTAGTGLQYLDGADSIQTNVCHILNYISNQRTRNGHHVDQSHL